MAAATRRKILDGLPLAHSPEIIETRIPSLIYDTGFRPNQTDELVSEAVRCGIRGFDAHSHHRRKFDKRLGAPLRKLYSQGMVSRSDLFLQANVRPPRTFNMRESVASSIYRQVDRKLHALRVDDGAPAAGTYIDSLIMRLPLDSMEDLMKAWRVLELFVPDTVKNLGVSFTTLENLQTLHQEARIKPKVVCNRFTSDNEYDFDLRRWCKSEGIIYQAFKPFTENPGLVNSPPVTYLCKALGVSRSVAFFSLLAAIDDNIVILNAIETPMSSYMDHLKTVESWAAEEENQYNWAKQVKHFKDLIGENSTGATAVSAKTKAKGRLLLRRDLK